MPVVPVWVYVAFAALFAIWSALCVAYGYNMYAEKAAKAELKQTITVVEEKARVRNHRPDNVRLRGVLLDGTF